MNRLKSLREDLDLTQTDVAKKINCSQNTLSNYELGVRDIPTKVLCDLARLYHTSTDYILGLTDDPTPPTKRKESRDVPTLESSLRPSL